MQIMYTMRDVDDLKLQRRATMSLPWLTDILHGCEANLAARQQEAERSRQQAEAERKVQQRTLDEQIAAAVAGRPEGAGQRHPTAPRTAGGAHQRHRPELVSHPSLQDGAAHE